MHTIVTDGDGHWYVIPADQINRWNSFDFDDGDYLPDWAVPIGGGPQRVTFDGYKIG